MFQVSKKFISELKLHQKPAYKIAQDAGVNPTALSKLICGIIEPRKNDERIIAVGSLLGISPEECFEGNESEVG